MDFSPMLKVLFGFMSAGDESNTQTVERMNAWKQYSHYECEHKDSGMVKKVDMTEISLRCVPGTEKGVK
jgi:hypothetical protein